MPHTMTFLSCQQQTPCCASLSSSVFVQLYRQSAGIACQETRGDSHCRTAQTTRMAGSCNAPSRCCCHGLLYLLLPFYRLLACLLPRFLLLLMLLLPVLLLLGIPSSMQCCVCWPQRLGGDVAGYGAWRRRRQRLACYAAAQAHHGAGGQHLPKGLHPLYRVVPLPGKVGWSNSLVEGVRCDTCVNACTSCRRAHKPDSPARSSGAGWVVVQNAATALIHHTAVGQAAACPAAATYQPAVHTSHQAARLSRQDTLRMPSSWGCRLPADRAHMLATGEQRRRTELIISPWPTCMSSSCRWRLPCRLMRR